MLSSFVGVVDINAAAVLIALSLSFGAVIITLIVKHRNRADVEANFALAKMSKEAEIARAMFQVETERDYRMKQLEQNLITSHVVKE